MVYFYFNTIRKLNRIALEHNINTGSKTWPRAANSLTRKLKTILSNLREAGSNVASDISRLSIGKMADFLKLTDLVFLLTPK
jgi:hypothetical protein